jgi:tetratricopeptide (TPR) repeat protein
LAQREFAAVERYQRRFLEAQKSPAARARAFLAMAELWRDHAREIQEYRRVLGEWSQELTEDPAPLSLLATSYADSGEYDLSIETRRRLCERLVDPVERAEELCEATRLVCLHQRDADYAVSLALEALTADPSALEALDHVAALLGVEGRFQELARIYEQVVQRFDDRALHQAVGPKLGALYRDQLGAPELTITAYERVLEEDSSRVDVRRQLVDLYSTRGEHSLALWHCRRAIKADPGDRELYRKIYSLLDRVGETDAAWNAAMVLDYLGEADIHEQLLADAHRPSGLLAAKDTIPDSYWGNGYLSPERDAELSEVLSSVAETAIDLRASYLRKKKRVPRLAPEARHDPHTSTTTLAKSLLWTSKLLSVRAPQLYVLDEVPGNLSAAPLDTPSALVSKSLGSGLSLAQLAFLWGRHLTLFRPEHYLSVFFPTLEDLSFLFSAALVAGECPAWPAASASGEEKKLARDLSKNMHPGSYERLRAACRAFHPVQHETRLRAWLRGVELTAGRAGLLACGDVSIAVDLVRKHPVQGETREDDQASDIMGFSVSDEYAKLRGRLGVAIA